MKVMVGELELDVTTVNSIQRSAICNSSGDQIAERWSMDLIVRSPPDQHGLEVPHDPICR